MTYHYVSTCTTTYHLVSPRTTRTTTDNTVPPRITPYHPVPLRTTPYHPAPLHTAPYRPEQPRTTPYHLVLHRTTVPLRTTPSNTALPRTTKEFRKFFFVCKHWIVCFGSQCLFTFFLYQQTLFSNISKNFKVNFENFDLFTNIGLFVLVSNVYLHFFYVNRLCFQTFPRISK